MDKSKKPPIKTGESKEEETSLTNETFHKALDVIYDSFKKRKPGVSFNIEAEINELAHMTDVEFKRKYPKYGN